MRKILVFVSLLVGMLKPAYAIRIVDRNSVANFRFSSGFGTSSPIANDDALFVGAGYDLSGVGWWRYPGDGQRVKHTSLIAPIFSVNAAHYPFAQGSTVDYLAATGTLAVNTVAASSTPWGDVSVTRYTRAFTEEDHVSALRVLDISSSNYVDQPLLVAGSRGGNSSIGTEFATSRVGGTASGIMNPLISAEDSSLSYIGPDHGDSGSPVLLPYKGEVTLASALDFVLFPSANTAALNRTLSTYGYALRFTIYDVPSDAANTANVWTGGLGSGDFFAGGNWSKGGAPGSLPVVFDADANGGQSAVVLNGDQSLRGMLFRPNEGGTGFTFDGSGRLTVGSTGIRNEDAKMQTFNVAIALSGAQNWEAANGGLVFNGNIGNGGNLLVVQGARNTLINGVISGTGGLAKDEGGMLTLGAVNAYTGTTFIHNGTLKTEINGALSSQTAVIFDAGNAGAMLDIGNTSQTIANLVSQTGGKGIVSLNGGTLTAGAGGSGVYAGSFTGTGTVVKVGSGTWRLQGDSSGFAGQFELQAGRFELDSQFAIGSRRQTRVAQGARLQTVNRSLDVAGGATFTATQNGTAVLTAGIDGHSLTGSGANISAVYNCLMTLDRQGTGTGSILYRFTNGGTGTAEIEFKGGISTTGNTLGGISLEANTLYTATGEIEFSGKITDAGGPGLHLIGAGTGTLILSNAEGNTYRSSTAAWGSTTILVNNETGSGTGSGGINFNTSAFNATTLGGTGRMAPQGSAGLAMGAGATLAPGAGGAGFLTMDLAGTSGKANFLAGAKFSFDLGVESDRMIFEGTSLGDVLFNHNVINLQLAEDFAPGTYTLFAFDSVGAYGGTLQIGTGLEEYGGSSLIYSATAIQLQVVPEPASILLITSSMTAFWVRRKQRRLRAEKHLETLK